jgi:hypothetical protein
VPDGSEDAQEEPDPATDARNRGESLDDRDTEPEEGLLDGTDTNPEDEFLDDRYKEPDVRERFDLEPEPPSPDDVDPEVQSRFWSLVLIFNVAVLGLGVGGLFILFRNDLAVGTQLVLAGAVVGVYGLYRYRTAKRALADDQNG